MKNLSFKQLMSTITALSAIAATVFFICHIYLEVRLFYSLSITFGTIFYHFAMRLIVGTLIAGIFHNKINYNTFWFSEHPFEQRLYKLLKVHKWKKHMPTYSPATFDMEKASVEDIIMATCQAELIHEIIFIFSFLPLLASLLIGDFYVFLITSVLSGCFDLSFVVLQRYNRPRLIKLLKRQKTGH